MEITVIYFVDKIVIESGLTADLHTDHCLEWVHYYFGYSPRQKYYVANIIRTTDSTPGTLYPALPVLPVLPELEGRIEDRVGLSASG